MPRAPKFDGNTTWTVYNDPAMNAWVAVEPDGTQHRLTDQQIATSTFSLSSGYTATVTSANNNLTLDDVKKWIETAAAPSPGSSFTSNYNTYSPAYAPARSNVIRPIWGPPAPEPDESFYSPEPVLGFRSITFSGSRFQGQHNGSWNTGMHIAKCDRNSHFTTAHPGPGWNCNCGIYAHKLSHVEGCGPGLLTLVAMENVIEHDLGYRASRAWVVAVTEDLGFPGWASEQEEANLRQRRMKLLVDHTWPLEVPFCATREKLFRVFDYMSKNPVKIPRPSEEAWQYCAQEERNQ